MIKCDYGCGREAKYQFKNGKWCCADSANKCLKMRQQNSESHKGKNNPMYGKDFTKNHRLKLSRTPWNKGKKFGPLSDDTKKKLHKSLKGRQSKIKGMKYEDVYSKQRSKEYKKKLSIAGRISIEQIQEKYPFFFKIEEIRYNPDKPGEKEIQVHCKNHDCPHSKEKGGWFTPTRSQFQSRVAHLEHDDGNDGCYFYCSDKCKAICPLYGLQYDPNNKVEKIYTEEEYQTFRKEVLNRDNYKCLYCGKPAEHVHHERPQKLEPFFALDPDYAISVCKECHYKYGHQGECSTGNLANKIC